MKVLHILLILAFYLTGSSVFAMPLSCEVHAPFQGIVIDPNRTLIVQYKNDGNWDALICGCSVEQNCESYLATWKYKGHKVTSYGPNYLRWLELYLGLPPETPGQNADQQGKIKIYNIGNKPITLSCNFSALGPPNHELTP